MIGWNESSDYTLGEKKKKVVAIIGPTAVGKTKLSVELAKIINAEIISGDSMQIYRGMDIGTAKIKKEEMAGIPHHLLNIKNPDESFSVAEFQSSVRKLIHEITDRGKIPMIVGGTGLYIQSVIYDYQFTQTPSDHAYRAKLERVVNESGIDPLYKQLQRIDPQSAERIHPNNIRRVIRALEVYYCTGKAFSDYQIANENKLIYDVALVGLTMERNLLYKRINKRVDLMFAEGLIKEVKSLYEKGIKDCQSIQAIGYKELYDYFEGKIPLDESVQQLKQNSRRYAKRQFTWFRNKMDVKWYDMTDLTLFQEKLAEIYTYVAGKLKI